MSFDETDLIDRLHAVAEGFKMPPVSLADDVRRGRRRVRRKRVLVAGVTVATVAVVLGVTAVVGGQGRVGSDGLEPVDRPSLVVGGVPVWYDANGLHRGDLVEQTPIELVVPEQPVGPDSQNPMEGALALVRSGAVYLDPATGDVWFHPWGGEPRIVGHNSEEGPGGDPNGDTAAWFEGSELVIYDTAAGREISRAEEGGKVVSGPHADHYPVGNGFRQVSAERVVWSTVDGWYSHDVRMRTTSVVPNLALVDVHDGVEVSGGGGGTLVLRVPGRDDERYPELEPMSRLSPLGSYLLAVGRAPHAAAIVDTMTGDLWRVPKNAYPWIAWSYGDIAMVDTEDDLLACDAARRTCESLPAERPFLMPTN